MNITVCDICGTKITTFKPMITGLRITIEEYNSGAKIRNLDICPACRSQISSIIEAKLSRRGVDIFD